MDRVYPRFLVIHHTAGHDVPAVTIDKYHARQGFGMLVDAPVPLVEEYIDRGFVRTSSGVVVSIGYHYLLRADGSVERGRPDFVRGAHCNRQNLNFNSLGIALTGNFDSRDNPTGAKGHTKPTDAQLRSLRELLYYLMDIYQIPKKQIILHRDVAATSCPGDRFNFQI